MFGKKNKDAVYLTYDEKSILLRALVELKKQPYTGRENTLTLLMS